MHVDVSICWLDLYLSLYFLFKTDFVSFASWPGSFPTSKNGKDDNINIHLHKHQMCCSILTSPCLHTNVTWWIAFCANIPTTQLCWHIFLKDPSTRPTFKEHKDPFVYRPSPLSIPALSNQMILGGISSLEQQTTESTTFILRILSLSQSHFDLLRILTVYSQILWFYFDPSGSWAPPLQWSIHFRIVILRHLEWRSNLGSLKIGLV